MPEAVLAGIVGVALFLPLIIAGLFYIVVDSLAATPLWVKLLFALFWVGAIFAFVMFAFIGQHHFDDQAGDWAWYWILGGIMAFLSAAGMFETYEDA